MPSRRIAVLGAGLMGCATALLLARRGHRVVLFDAADAPFARASRWNEGKIHLGFLYSADPTLATARKVLTGGLLFRPLVEEMIGCSIEPFTTQASDIFLCHRDSVVSPESMEAYYHRVAELVCEHAHAGDYLAEVSQNDVQRMSSRELGELSDSPDIVAGFRVPERSISTNWLADRFVEAIAAEPSIELRLRTRISRVVPVAGEKEQRWVVESEPAGEETFDWVVNALWEGRLAVDLSVGIEPTAKWSNRYRLALFIKTRRPVDVPSALIATGPFGDLKNYNSMDFYASWYPLGLRTDTAEVSPVTPGRLAEDDAQKLADQVLSQLESYLPAVRQITENAAQVSVEGGWVHASGTGLLSDPAATLHRRTDFGITQRGTYVSVDTGKYSTAPWLAHRVAESIG